MTQQQDKGEFNCCGRAFFNQRSYDSHLKLFHSFMTQETNKGCPHTDIEGVVREFDQLYRAEFRWVKERMSQPDAIDWLTQRLTALVEGAREDGRKEWENHNKQYLSRKEAYERGKVDGKRELEKEYAHGHSFIKAGEHTYMRMDMVQTEKKEVLEDGKCERDAELREILSHEHFVSETDRRNLLSLLTPNDNQETV